MPQSEALSRRRFLTVTASAALVAVSGCGTGSAPAATAGTPRTGGRLRAAFAGGGAKETLDPHATNLFVEVARAKAMFDKLAEFDSTLTAVPRLAESWDSDPTLTRWRVTLRDARFHNGQKVRAADVLASYARITDPNGTRRAKATLAPIDLGASRAISDTVVEFALTTPLAEFPNLLAALGSSIIPEGTTDFTKPIGSGPFQFVSFDPGRSLLTKRFDDYWEDPAYLDELEFVVSNEESARINALLGGQVEYAHEINPSTATTYDDSDRVQVYRLPRSNMHALAMKVDRPPFDKPEVRQAFFLMVNRQELVDAVLPGAGEIGNDLFGKGYQYYADSIPQRIQDLDQAKWLLKKAGAENLTVTLDTSTVATGLVEAASVFAEQARDAGVTVNVVQGNKDTYWSDVLNKGMMAGYRSGAMPIETHISQRLLSGSTTNATKWTRPDFDALYRTAQSTVDTAQRGAVYQQMQQILHSEGGFLVWGFADWIVASATNVGGISTQSPANTLDWARFDRVWLG